MSKRKDRRLSEEHKEPEVIRLEGILDAKIIRKLANGDILALTFQGEEEGTAYSVAIPNVLTHKHKKEVLEDGESGAGSTGVQTSAEFETERSESEEDQNGDEGEDSRAEAE